MNINAQGYIQNTHQSENTKVKLEETNSPNIKTSFTEKISKDDALELRAQITQNANEMMLKSITIQSSFMNQENDFASLHESFQSFLSDIGYDGKPIAELSQSEAADLVSEDGIFGISETSQRIANFVISGAGGDEDRFRAGREGMIQGFKEAEDIFGELPEISKKTMQAAIEMVDKAMHDAGFSILNQEA